MVSKIARLTGLACGALLAAVGCSSAPPAGAPPASAPLAQPRPAVTAIPACVPAISPDVASPQFPAELNENQGYRLGAPRRMRPTEDGRYVLFLRASTEGAGGRAALWETDVASGQSHELVAPDDVLGGTDETVSVEERARRERQRLRGSGFTHFEASRDGAVVVLQISGRLHVWRRATGSTRALAGMGVAGRPVEFLPLVDQTHLLSTAAAAAAESQRTAAHFRTHLHGIACDSGPSAAPP
jgi:hypothetical protein